MGSEMCIRDRLWALPFPGGLRSLHPAANWASLAVLAALVYYSLLSLRLTVGILPWLLAGLVSIHAVDQWRVIPLWTICLALFVVAWVGQFVGHAIEGKRPSFFKDLQFLMIGPLWLLADVYRRLGIPT